MFSDISYRVVQINIIVSINLVYSVHQYYSVILYISPLYKTVRKKKGRIREGGGREKEIKRETQIEKWHKRENNGVIRWALHPDHYEVSFMRSLAPSRPLPRPY